MSETKSIISNGVEILVGILVGGISTSDAVAERAMNTTIKAIETTWDKFSNIAEKKKAFLQEIENTKDIPEKEKKLIIDYFKKDSPILPELSVMVFDSIDDELRSSEIISRVVQRYHKNPSSILPSDYAGTTYCRIAVLKKIAHGVYTLSEDGKKVWKFRKQEE